MRIKKILKQTAPDFIISFWHYLQAWWGSVKYSHPSENLLVIGVTGTSGKSSTIHFLRQALEGLGYKVGSLSTADFYIVGEQKLNDRKMTMLGRGENHKFLRKMKEENCDIAILETTSEGALQHRHRFINYDFIIFTNLYREHIEAHGGFQNYKNCKLEILEYVSKCKPKYWCKTGSGWEVTSFKKKNKECNKIPKTCIVSANNDHTLEGLEFDFDEKNIFAREDKKIYDYPQEVNNEVVSKENKTSKDGISFEIGNTKFNPKVYGKHNIWNLLAAISVAKSLSASWSELKQIIDNVDPPPGRVEFIEQAESHGFKVIVDYAFEPKALQELYKVVDLFDTNNIIHVCGSAGGGRDTWRREEIGKIAGKKADKVIVTNEDPYDEDPEQIISQVAEGAKQTKLDQENLYQIKSREEAIEQAIKLAEENAIVLVTGKGSEQGIVEQGELIPWDDREVVREKITKIYESR